MFSSAQICPITYFPLNNSLHWLLKPYIFYMFIPVKPMELCSLLQWHPASPAASHIHTWKLSTNWNPLQRRLYWFDQTNEINSWMSTALRVILPFSFSSLNLPLHNCMCKRSVCTDTQAAINMHILTIAPPYLGLVEMYIICAYASSNDCVCVWDWECARVYETLLCMWMAGGILLLNAECMQKISLLFMWLSLLESNISQKYICTELKCML